MSYRFLLAALLLFAWCRARGLPVAQSAREHAWIALQGVPMFSVSYIFVYYAEQHLVSGLVAVGYSASPLLNMLGMRLFFRAPMSRRVAAGSVLGMAGIALVFWPEFGKLGSDRDTAVGAIFTALSVVVSALSSMAAHRNQDAKLGIWQTMAWGMLYGAVFSAAWNLAAGNSFGFEWTPSYVGSLIYLAILGSIVAFAGYLTLLGRIGAARAGYIGVMVPIVALAISAAAEGFRWGALTVLGVAISVAGNVLVLRR